MREAMRQVPPNVAIVGYSHERTFVTKAPIPHDTQPAIETHQVDRSLDAERSHSPGASPRSRMGTEQRCCSALRLSRWLGRTFMTKVPSSYFTNGEFTKASTGIDFPRERPFWKQHE